jgi:hypothetical protein
VTFTEPGSQATTCAISDASGNHTDCETTATMVDDTAPSITCPPAQTVECTGSCATQVAVGDAQAADNCGVAETGCAPGTGAYCLGDTVDTCHAVDRSGNRTECTTTITVVDTTPPEPRCDAPASQIAGQGAMAPAPDMILGATDACQGDALVVTQDPPAGTPLPLGDHLVTVTARDPSGNVATCETIFTVRGVLVDAPPYGQVLVYEEAGSQDGHPCLSGPAPADYPGTSTPITVVACFDDAYQTAQSIAYEVTVPLPLTGDTPLEGTYDPDSDQLCLSQTTDVDFPGTNQPLTVTACLGTNGTALDSLTYSTTVPIDPVGEVTLSGSYDVAGDSLCLSGLTNLNAGLGVTATACLGDGATSVQSVSFQTSLVTPIGTATGSGAYDASTGQICFDGSFPVDVLGATVTARTHACMDLSSVPPKLGPTEIAIDLDLPPMGGVTVRGTLDEEGKACLIGELSGDVSKWLPVPGVTLLGLSAQVCIADKKLGPIEVDGSVRLGDGPSAMTLAAHGSYAGPQDVSLSLGLAPDTTWAPFAEIPGIPEEIAQLAFTELGGTIALTADGPAFDVNATVGDGHSLTLIPGTPGVVLDRVAAKGHLAFVNGEPEFEISLAGDVTIPLGFDDLILSLEGVVTGTTLKLEGTVTSKNGGLSLQPFADVLGPGAFVVGLGNAHAELDLDFAAEKVHGAVDANASASVLGASVNAGVDMDLELGSGGWSLTIAGILQHLNIPVGDTTLSLGDYGHLILIGSTKKVDGLQLDVDGDPSNGKEASFDVKPGLAFIADADLTFIYDIFPGANANVTLQVEGAQAFSVKGTLKLPFDIIHPEDHLPGLNRAGFDHVDVEADVSGETVSVALGGALSIEPIDRHGNVQRPLAATAHFLLDTEPSLGGEIDLIGLWKEPLLIPNFAFMNPAMEVKISFIEVEGIPVPYPSALGVNRQAFFLKSGDWPESIELDSLGNPLNLPENIFSIGGTIFYDIAITKSGVCLLGVCAPLPTIIARFDFEHLRLQDFVDAVNAIRDGGLALASLPGLGSLRDVLPSQLVEPIQLPFDIDLRKVQLGLSTHNVTKFGIDFTAGVEAALDVAVTVLGEVHELSLEGYLSPEGGRFAGQSSPITFIPGLAIVGDPYRREVALNGGQVTMPDADGFDAARTLEAWVRTSGPGTVMRKSDGTDGYDLAIGGPAPTACKHAPCPDAFTLVAHVLRGGASRELRTEHGVVAADTRAHVALTLQEDGTATFYVDGKAAAATDSAPGLLPGASGAALEMGAGLTTIDDMRVWTRARTPAELAGESRVMPYAFHFDDTLVARYEVDFDTGAVANDSRVGGAPAGAYVGGAVPAIARDDQDLFLKLVLDSQDLAHSGLWFRGGVDMDWDPPIPGAELSYAAEAAIGAGEANGTLFVRHLPLIDLTGLGGFILGGDGPNAVPGDFDDGLYLSGDLMRKPAPTVNASGRLTFVEGNGTPHEVAAGAVLFDCLKAGGCASVTDYSLRTSGHIDMDVPFNGFGTIGIHGNHMFNSDDLAFHVDGRLSALGQDLIAGDITVNRDHATLTADLDIGDVGGVDFGVASSLAIDVTYSPPRVCGDGATSVLIGGLGNFDGTIGACLGTNPSAHFSGRGQASLAGIPLADVDIDVNTATGVFIRNAMVNIPGLFNGHVQGHYVSPADFALTGTSDLNFAALIAMHTALNITPQGGDVTIDVNPGCDACLVQSRLTGRVSVDGGAVTYDLQGAATLKVAGFSLANGQLRLANGAFTASGTVDIGIGTADVSGSIDGNTGAFSFTGNLGGSILGGLASTAGTVTLNNAGASANGALTLFGSSGNFQAAVSPNAFSVDSQMHLALPTAAGNYDIGSSNVHLAVAPGSVTATVDGSYGIPGLGASLHGTVSNGSFDISGQAILGNPAAPLGTGTLRITPNGATLDLTLQLAGLPPAVFHGDLGAVPGVFVVNGYIDLGSLHLASAAITLDGTHATLSTSISLGSFLGYDLGSASLSLSLQYNPFQLCGDGHVAFPIDPSIGCTVGACVAFPGGVPTFQVNSLDCGLGICLGDAMCNGGFCDLLGHCWGKKADGDQCAGLLIGDHECQSGFCDPWAQFPVAVCAQKLPDGIGCLQDGECQSGRCGDRPGVIEKHCFTPHTRYINDECYDADHCAVGTCFGNVFSPSRCLCVENGQCGASPGLGGDVCQLGDWAVGLNGWCVPPRTDGQGCRATSECAAGLQCSNGLCVQPEVKHNWEACSADAQCKDGSLCYGGQCRCWTHEQCQVDSSFGPGSYCDMGTWLLGNNEGQCHPKVGENAYCEDDVWCTDGLKCSNNRCIRVGSKHNWEACTSSDQCMAGSVCWQDGRCRCFTHEQCTSDSNFGPNSYCDMGTWLNLPWNYEGQCHAPKNPDGAYCEDGQWCSSGACANNQCYTRNSRAIGQACIAGDQCTTGSCNGICQCTSHDQCGAGNFCNHGACEAKREPDNHVSCEDGNWCTSGLCGWSPKWSMNECFTYANFGGGHWCDMDQECASNTCRLGFFVWACQ